MGLSAFIDQKKKWAYMLLKVVFLPFTDREEKIEVVLSYLGHNPFSS